MSQNSSWANVYINKIISNVKSGFFIFRIKTLQSDSDSNYRLQRGRKLCNRIVTVHFDYREDENFAIK